MLILVFRIISVIRTRSIPHLSEHLGTTSRPKGFGVRITELEDTLYFDSLPYMYMNYRVYALLRFFFVCGHGAELCKHSSC